VKEDVVYIAGPVRYQVWHGWPTDDDLVTGYMFAIEMLLINNSSVNYNLLGLQDD